MIVLLVVEPGVDGVFRHVEGLADHLLAAGHTVHLAHSTRRGSAGLDALVARVAAAGGRTLDLRVGNAPHPRDAVALRRLGRLVRETRPDVVHAHSSKAGVLARARALPGDPALVYTPHAYYGLGRTGGARAAVYTAVERALARRGRTITISPDEAAFARDAVRVPLDRLAVAPNPVDVRRFRPPSYDERRAARRRLGVPDDVVLLGTVARPSAQKDPATLYAAYAEVAAGRPDLWLAHLGSGPLDADVALLRERLGLRERTVRLAGADEPAWFYQALDGFVLTSRYEAGWPLVLLEAMATGLPLVVTEAPGLTDLASSGLSHAWTAPPGDVPAVAAALRSWLASRADGVETDHRERAATGFGPQRCYGEVVAVYEAELGPTGPAGRGNDTRRSRRSTRAASR